jgi:hypothetical protein
MSLQIGSVFVIGLIQRLRRCGSHGEQKAEDGCSRSSGHDFLLIVSPHHVGPARRRSRYNTPCMGAKVGERRAQDATRTPCGLD